MPATRTPCGNCSSRLAALPPASSKSISRIPKLRRRRAGAAAAGDRSNRTQHWPLMGSAMTRFTGCIQLHEDRVSISHCVKWTLNSKNSDFRTRNESNFRFWAIPVFCNNLGVKKCLTPLATAVQGADDNDGWGLTKTHSFHCTAPSSHHSSWRRGIYATMPLHS